METALSFVITGGNSPILFKFAEEVLDQMSSPISMGNNRLLQRRKKFCVGKLSHYVNKFLYVSCGNSW